MKNCVFDFFVVWAATPSSEKDKDQPVTCPTHHIDPYWMSEAPTQKVDLAAVIDLTWSLLMCGRLPTKLRNSGTRQSCCTCVSSSLEIKRQSFNFREGALKDKSANEIYEDVTRIHPIPEKNLRPKLETCVKCLSVPLVCRQVFQSSTFSTCTTSAHLVASSKPEHVATCGPFRMRWWLRWRPRCSAPYSGHSCRYCRCDR